MQASDLIYDWNKEDNRTFKKVQIRDETLRDGLQGGVPRIPTIEEKLQLLTTADRLGLQEAGIGFPAQESAYQECLELCKGARERGLKLRLGMLGRMLESDITAIERIQQSTGHPVIASLFVACSPIRRYVAEWDIDEIERMTRDGISLAVKLGLPVLFGPEDCTRAEPKVMERLFLAAAESGAEVIAITDTVGHATPLAVERIVKHFRTFLDKQSFKVSLDFHGHNDKGLGLVNAIAAVRAGIDRIHGTILGIGERSGNAPLDLILVNLKLQGLWEGDISGLTDYFHEVARVCQLNIPTNYPIFGDNAFFTQVGILASAILKAESLGEPDIAALVCSGVDPRLVGLDYGVKVGPYSGRANVKFLLQRKNLEATDEAIEQILTQARTENRILAEEEVYAIANGS